jgi:predicted  nucleic acid-binding Zn-ribbon protein
MDHRCTHCQRSYKKRAVVMGQMVCPYCNQPQGKQPRSVTRAQHNRYRELVDFKSRAAGER